MSIKNCLRPITKRLVALTLSLVMLVTVLPPQKAQAYFTATDAIDAVFLAIDTQACFVDNPGWDTCGTWALDVLFMALPLVPNLFRKTATRSFQIADKTFDNADDYLRFVGTLDSVDDYKKYGVAAFSEADVKKGVGIVAPYKDLKKAVDSLDGQIEIHHILPKSIAKQLGYADGQLDDILAVPLDMATHRGKGSKITSSLNMISNKFKSIRANTVNLALADVPLLLGDLAYHFKDYPKIKKIALMQAICSPLGQQWLEECGSALLYSKFCLTEHEYADDVWANDPEHYLNMTGYSLTNLEAQRANAPLTNYKRFEYAGHTYEIVNRGTTYQEAVTTASAYGAHLVTIDSFAEQSYLIDVLKQTELSWNMNSYWIGGEYPGVGINWYERANTKLYPQMLGKRYDLYSDVNGKVQSKTQVGQIVTVKEDGTAYHSSKTSSRFFGKNMNGYILEYDRCFGNETPNTLPGSDFNETTPITTVTNQSYNRGGYGFDKGKYTGQWDTRPQGNGTLIYDSDNGYSISVSGQVYRATKYEGTWIDGRRSGKGVLSFANSGKYDGVWNTDGVYFDGYYISGNYRFRVKQILKADGVTIQSEWIGDWEKIPSDTTSTTSGENQAVVTRFYDRGGFHYDKGQYSGGWTDRPDGYGTLLYDSDTGYTITMSGGKTYPAKEYTGNWSNGKRYGKGIMTFANGVYFDGDWNINGIYFTGVCFNGGFKRPVRQIVNAYGASITMEWLGDWERI